MARTDGYEYRGVGSRKGVGGDRIKQTREAAEREIEKSGGHLQKRKVGTWVDAGPAFAPEFSIVEMETFWLVTIPAWKEIQRVEGEDSGWAFLNPQMPTAWRNEPNPAKRDVYSYIFGLILDRAY